MPLRDRAGVVELRSSKARGTLNPTLDFNSPSGGRYDVWIGTFAPGGSLGGTLYVTENTGNHP